MRRRSAIYIVLALATALALGWLGSHRGLPAQGTALAASAAAAPQPQPATAPEPKPRPAAFYGPELENRSAYLPAQCYAKTRDADPARVHNSCFVCHQAPREPNYVDDAEVQSTLSLARYATVNHWTNLLAPPAPAELGDAELLAWVRTSNYFAADGGLTLAHRLSQLDDAWDDNHDGNWGGFVPDCWFNVDERGFDADPEGKRTGWRAYNYAPTPGMFWPTNGSAGDAFIRLPEAYRQDADGQPDERIYQLNLAIVEAYVKRTAVPIPTTDERPLGSDLDGDGVLGTAHRVAFVWPPKDGRLFHYVGKATTLDPKQAGWPVSGLFPTGTEFLHSVRYLDVVDGKTRMAARLKELRYMRKTKWLNYGQLQQLAEAEAREKLKSPDKLKLLLGDRERGVSTGVGWLMQSFTEDKDGELRPQSVEENGACIGCHGGLGANTDATLSFVRKLPVGSFRDGWSHPSAGGGPIAEPRRADGRGEYADYLERVGGGDDFRSNDEVLRKFFRPDGSLDPAMRKQLARDISTLIMPSAERALTLDRAYLGIVRTQSFLRGRDVVVGHAPEIERQLEQDGATGIDAQVEPAWKRPSAHAM